MGKDIKQAKWECTTEGKVSGKFPGGLSVDFDLTKICLGWTNYTEAEKFIAYYGFKQKCMDKSSDTKWTYQDKIDRAKVLFDYMAKEGKLPKSERTGGFGISKKSIAEKIEAREKPLTPSQKALLAEFGLID